MKKVKEIAKKFKKSQSLKDASSLINAFADYILKSRKL